MRKLVVLLLSIGIFSCQNKEVKKSEDKAACDKDSVKEKKFEMYEMSEMASLMEQMYAHNQQLRLRIIKGDTVGKFPEFFNKIFSCLYIMNSFSKITKFVKNKYFFLSSLPGVIKNFLKIDF